MSADAVAHVYRYSPYTGATFSVHLAVADSVNDQHGNRFWMGVRKLARKARCQRRSAQIALARLVADGWLEDLSPPKPTGDTRQYRFLFNEDRTVIYDGRETGGANSAHPESEGAQSATGGGAEFAQEGAQSERPNPRVNPREPNYSSDFDRFWAVYPRRGGKGDAFRAWVKATKKDRIEADRIVAGAERYRDDPNRDPSYTALPATWLRAERWDDDPLPPKPKLNGHKPEPTPDTFARLLPSGVRWELDEKGIARKVSG